MYVCPNVGDLLEVYWPLDSQLYPGQFEAVEIEKHIISYDDVEK